MVLGAAAAAPTAQATLVRIDTSAGPVDVELFDTAAPKTVANFLARVRARAYEGSFVHRLASGVSLHLGAWSFPPLAALASTPTVPNEFSTSRPNRRGTVAMEKAPGSTDSAASAWFVNLADNSALYDRSAGGSTVFGRLTPPSLALADQVATLPVVHAGVGFESLPLLKLPGFAPLARENLIAVDAVRELPTSGAPVSDRVFNFLEAVYPQFAPAPRTATLTGGGYQYRYYETTRSYLGTRDGNVYYLVPSLSPEVRPLGSLAEWFERALANGY